MMYLPDAPWTPAFPDLTCCPNCRTQQRYLQVVAQFDVQHAERYRIRDTTGDGKADTFCNIFAADCAEAMGVFLPHWWLGKELSANALNEWLKGHGSSYGWEQLSGAHVATAAVLAGMFTIASWRNPKGGPGHVAVLLPVPTDADDEPWIAQAGSKNFSQGSLRDGFGSIKPDFFTCR